MNRDKFPYGVVIVVTIWAIIGVAYLVSRWRARPKASYIIPRVFVLCSPRTVQFHYELILRVGLYSYDYNPEKHDIDITFQGAQRNEVVPMTRLNTKTLSDEPLITSLSIIVYRLVEMPHLGSLILRHSGPLKAWVYAYDFTVIDLTTNKEQYYTINKYIGSLNKVYALEEHGENDKVVYPIDDVPLPQWTLEDIFLVIFIVANSTMLSLRFMPLACHGSTISDIGSVILVTLNGLTVIFFLEWLLYYYARWNLERREYFNLNDSGSWSFEVIAKIVVYVMAIGAAAYLIFDCFRLQFWVGALIWLLATTNVYILVIGFWYLAHQLQLCEYLVGLGMRVRGIETISVGLRYSEIVSDIQTKSGSTSDDGNSQLSSTSKLARSIGPRSSVKSFGFDPITGHPNRHGSSKVGKSRLSVPSHTAEHNHHKSQSHSRKAIK